MKRFILILLFLSFLVPLGAQPLSTIKLSDENGDPLPYTDDEFPQWTKDLRRAEIIFFGSAPFTFLFSSVGYRTGKWGWNYITAEEGETIAGWNELEEQDQINMVFVGLGLSFSIALTDFILGKIEGRHND